MENVNEQDWKLFRKKLPIWQEAFISKLIEEYAVILSKNMLPSEKFWALEKRIFHDKKNVGVTAVMSRSRMIENIYSLIGEGAITKNDLSDFSEELQNKIY